MSTIGHVAAESGKWAWGIVLLLAALAIAAVIVLFVGAFLWEFAHAVWAERLWFVLVAVGFGVALVWASIKGSPSEGSS